MLTEAGLEPALLLVLTERLPINGPGHMVVGFRLNLLEPPLICFLSTIGIDWLVIQTMVNKP